MNKQQKEQLDDFLKENAIRQWVFERHVELAKMLNAGLQPHEIEHFRKHLTVKEMKFLKGIELPEKKRFKQKPLNSTKQKPLNTTNNDKMLLEENPRRFALYLIASTVASILLLVLLL